MLQRSRARSGSPPSSSPLTLSIAPGDPVASLVGNHPVAILVFGLLLGIIAERPVTRRIGDHQIACHRAEELNGEIDYRESVTPRAVWQTV